eukprot:00179.XXX_1190_1526_1 [CDS] Oithona nana genome sequencing.
MEVQEFSERKEPYVIHTFVTPPESVCGRQVQSPTPQENVSPAISSNSIETSAGSDDKPRKKCFQYNCGFIRHITQCFCCISSIICHWFG